MHGGVGTRWRGAGRPRPWRPLRRPGGAPPLGVHHRTGGGRAGVARRDPRHRRRPGPGGPVGRGAGSTGSGAAGQTRPRAGQRPGHAPGSVQRPVVWSRGARSAFADMSRSVSAAPAGVNPRPRPPSAPLDRLDVHPADHVRPAVSSTPGPAHRPTRTAEKRGRISWPRNAAATRSPGSTPTARGADPTPPPRARTPGACPRGPASGGRLRPGDGRRRPQPPGVPQSPSLRQAGSASAA